MTARDDILASIRSARKSGAANPPPYQPPSITEDLSTRFAQRAAAADSDVRLLKDIGEVPQAVTDILRARNMAAAIHISEDSELGVLSWDRLTVERKPPGPDDAAVATAAFAIAETGTLVYPTRAGSPASWHFRPGLEIAIIRASAILAHFEDVLAQLKTDGGLPATVNLVTGPSRTGDIEQTLELGAHGPKALAILIVDDR
jgi:L-lactate dehydrogenase complex protein LldG